MAKLKGFGLDIGQHAVKLVELRKDRSGVHLYRAKVMRTGVSPEMNREERENATSFALRKVLEGVDIGQNPLAIATPGLSAFIRYVKLPPVTPQRLKQIIGYEAQQQVPFPLNEVVWDYQVLDVKSEAETNVVLVAIKKDVLSSLIDSVKSCGMEPSFVEHRPLAVYNAVKFNEETGPGEVSVIIDVGERTTDISVERDGELCWTRSARIGSADITNAIAGTFDIPFEEAERIKEEKAVILASPEQEKTADGNTLKLWEAIKTPVTGIVSELQRTINYFQTQLGGMRADKIIITGGLTNIPNIDVLLENVIGADIVRINPLKKISAPAGLLTGIEPGGQLSVAVGLALRSLGEGFSKVNLLPESIISRQELRKKRAYLVLSGVTLALMVGIASIFSAENYSAVKRNVEIVSEELSVYQEYDRLIRDEKRDQERVDKKIEKIRTLVSSFWQWPDFMLEVARVVPEGVNLTGISMGEAAVERDGRRRDDFYDDIYDGPMMRRPSPARNAVDPEGKKLELRGRAENFDKISALIAMVEESPNFKDVEVVSAQRIVERARGERVDRRRPPRDIDEWMMDERPPGEEEEPAREFVEFVVHVEIEGDFPQ